MYREEMQQWTFSLHGSVYSWIILPCNNSEWHLQQWDLFWMVLHKPEGIIIVIIHVISIIYTRAIYCNSIILALFIQMKINVQINFVTFVGRMIDRYTLITVTHATNKSDNYTFVYRRLIQWVFSWVETNLALEV